MATKIIRDLKNVNNVDMLNAIRHDASLDYVNRVPEATQANFLDTVKKMMDYGPTKNEFVNALVNQIGLIMAKSMSWTNPLAEFKRGQLEYGDTIEEIYVGILQAHTYETDREHLEHDIFGQELPDIQTNFHKINRAEYYKVTINDALLRRAFLEPNGLSKFVADLMAAPETSDSLDEFKQTCRLFATYEAQGGFFKVNVPDVASLSSTDIDARTALRKLRAMAGTLKYPSTRYNAAGMPTFARTEDLVIFVSPEFNAAIDVEALAAAFNIDQATAHGRIIEIPQEEFGIAGCQAIMTTKDFFVIADSLWETRSQENPVGLYRNFFLHHHEVISFSRFVPAVMFTTGPGDEIVTLSEPVTGVSSITVFDGEETATTSLLRGGLYSLEAEALTTGPNDAVRWEVFGNTSPSTYVRQTGTLYVGPNEGATTLRVRATATYLDPEDLMKDGQFTEVNLSVTGPALHWGNSSSGPIVEMIALKGVDVPGFDPNVFVYNAVPVEGGTVTKAQVSVTGPDSGDVVIATANGGTTVTVYSPSSPGDPTYTINVVAPA